MIVEMFKTSLILILALGTATIFRRRSAALRHAVLSAGLVAALAVPLLSHLVPELPVPVEKVAAQVKTPEYIEKQVSSVSYVVAGFNPSPLEVSRRVNPVLAIWLAGSICAGFVFVFGVVRILWIVIRADSATSPAWNQEITGLSRTLGLRRRALLIHTTGKLVGTWGFLRPRILLPDCAKEWDNHRIQIVLAHELAHIKRLDWPIQMLAEIARTVYWFNPLFWILCSRLRSESEYASDDIVLGLGIDAKDYAAHLLDLALELKSSKRVWSAVLAMANPPNLERRFIAMLNSSLNHRSATRTMIAAVAILAFGITLPLAAMRAVSPSAIEPAPLLSPPKIEIAPLEPPKKTSPVRRTAAFQEAFGSFSGYVADPSGAVVPGVFVALVNNATNQSATTVANETGNFAFARVPAGRYELRADLPGFTPFRRGNIDLAANQEVRFNVRLTLGGLQQQVVVTAVGQPRPAPPPETPRRIRVGGNVAAANLISQVKPIYPPSAQADGIEGTVTINAIIATDGVLQIHSMSSNSSNKDFVDAAFTAVKQWRYRPTMLNGSPVEVLTTIDIDFKLTQ